MSDLSLAGRVRWGTADALTLARRNLLVWLKVPAFIVFTVIQPVMFTLLFRYVFGGAIHTSAPSYVDYLLPGVIGQTAAFTSFGTAISLAQEIQMA
jgi:ABC-2 type transport system permease protein